MKILVIDGQGGRMGKTIIEQLKINIPEINIIAVGTNSIATSTMLKAGADLGATGENPIIYNSSDADIIIGPIGIIIANSLLGEITSKIAVAVSSSKAKKLLIPTTKCNTYVIGTRSLSLSDYVNLVVEEVKAIITNLKC